MKRKLILFPLMTLLLLSACGAVAPATPSLEGTSWQLESLAGEPALPGTDVTIEFKDGQAGGQAGCNGYGGAYKVDGNEITFRELASTLMACADPAVMEQESAYLQFLGEVQRFELVEGQLQLVRADGEALVFVPAP